MKRSFILFFVCNWCLTISGQAQSWEKASNQQVSGAYKKACNWLVNTPSYYFKLKYASYKDHLSKEQVECSTGYYKRVANSLATEAAGQRTIQNEKLKVIVDTADRVVTVMNPGNLSPVIASTEDLDLLLANAKNLRRMRLGKSERYRIDFNKNDQYEAYEFVVSDGGMLETLVYYYSEQVEKIYDENSERGREVKMKPRLEITFSAYQVPAKHVAFEFSERSVLVQENGKISLTGEYKNYRLLDYRVSKK